MSGATPAAERNVFERLNAWIDIQMEDHPVIATITVLALTALACVGAMYIAFATSFNPFAVAAAAIITTASIAYGAWLLSKICMLNDNDEGLKTALRGERVKVAK